MFAAEGMIFMDVGEMAFYGGATKWESINELYHDMLSSRCR